MPIPPRRLAAIGLASALALSLAACSDSGSSAQQDVESHASTSPQLDQAALNRNPARALERASIRWDHKVAGDWIEVYGYYLPEMRQGLRLGQFLTDKEHHVFENPSKPVLLGTRDNLAFVEVTSLWTTVHPMVLAANNLGSVEDLRQELAIVETWVFAHGDWHIIKEERQQDFLDGNPDIRLGAR